MLAYQADRMRAGKTDTTVELACNLQNYLPTQSSHSSGVV